VQKVKPGVVAIKTPALESKGTSGSGVIIDERGFVLTTWHVVGSVPAVTVVLLDKSELAGKVLFADPATDLAVIKVEADRKLPAQVLGASADVLEGEDVIAVGHPHGYAYTVTKGIVSALGRELEMPNGHMMNDLIQTSTPINSGNSGGPLVNMNGEVIGINVAVRQDSQGIAFAISTATVKRLLAEQLGAYEVAGVVGGRPAPGKAATAAAPRQGVATTARVTVAEKGGGRR
jgi:serine protease Do